MMDAWISNGPVKRCSDGIWCHKEMMEMIDEPLTKQKTSDLYTTPTTHQLQTKSFLDHQLLDKYIQYVIRIRIAEQKNIQKLFCIAHCLFRKILFASCLRSMTKNVFILVVLKMILCVAWLEEGKTKS